MANYRRGSYDFVVDSSFNPFSMQEMLAPLAMYKDAYEKSEEAYINLTDNADKFKYLSETLPEGSKARQIYEGYANDLKAQADDLAKNGLSMGNRRGLLNLKRRYQGEIGRLQTIDEIRRAQIKEQRELLLKDPSRLFSRRADLTDFDKYLENPDLGYESYSGAMLEQQVGDTAAAVAKGLNDYIKTGRLDEYTKTWIEGHGYTAADVAQAIRDPQNDRTGILSSIVRDTVNTSGIPQWADASTLREAYGWANRGLWKAIGQSQVHSFEDYDARLKAKEDSELRVAAKKAQMEANAAQQAGVGGLTINPVNIYSKSEVDDINSTLKNYGKYFTTDAQGRTVMTQEGLKAYYNKSHSTAPLLSPSGMPVKSTNGTNETDSAFKQFIDSLGGDKYIKNGKMQPGNLGNLWDRYKRQRDRYDATRTTEFDYTLYPSQQKDAKSAILTAARGTRLQEVDFDSKENRFIPTGDELSMEDLDSDKYSVVSTRMSPYGNTVLIKNDKGEVKRYHLPKGINPTNEGNRDKAMQAALRWQQVISSGEFVDKQGNSHKLSSEDRAYALQRYREALQQAYLYHSQLFVSNKTKEQEFNPYSY